MKLGRLASKLAKLNQF